MKKNSKPDGKRKTAYKTHILVLAALVLLIGTVAGETLAYLTKSSGPVSNTFTLARAPELKINETFNGTKKSDVYVHLDGGQGSYFVRAAIIVTLQDDDGNILPVVPAAGTDYTMALNTTDWTLHNGYYYYDSRVKAGGKTADLIESCTSNRTDCHLCVDVLAQCIQAAPTSAVQTAWGYLPGSN